MIFRIPKGEIEYPKPQNSDYIPYFIIPYSKEDERTLLYYRAILKNLYNKWCCNSTVLNKYQQENLGRYMLKAIIYCKTQHLMPIPKDAIIRGKKVLANKSQLHFYKECLDRINSLNKQVRYDINFVSGKEITLIACLSSIRGHLLGKLSRKLD